MKKHDVDLELIWMKLRAGTSVTALAKQLDTNHRTLGRKLLRNNPDEYHRIVERNRHLRENRVTIDMQKAWRKLRAGTSVTALAGELGLTFQTLRQRLLKENPTEYRTIAEVNLLKTNPQVQAHKSYRVAKSILRNRSKNPTQIQLAWEMFEAGTSVTAIAKELGLTFDTLRRRLLKEEPNRYRKLAQRNCHLWGRCYSTFEQTVRDSLDALKVNYGFHVKLNVEEHYYIVDFLIGHMILEVAGMRTKSYWERTKEKLITLLRSGRKVILVVGQKRGWMEHYIPQHENLIVTRIEEFTTDASNILREPMDTPLGKASADRRKIGGGQ